MIEILAPFTVGLLGSLHCVGMCGPLVLACSLKFRLAAAGGENGQSSGIKEGSGRAAVAVCEGYGGPFGGRRGMGQTAVLSLVPLYHLAFHSGRIMTYGILGAMVAGLFHSLEVQKFSMEYRGGVTLVCGILLVAIGLFLSGLVRFPGFLAQSAPGLLVRKMSSLAGAPGVSSKFGLGLAAGLLPCGLSWAMVVAAAGTLHPVKGFVAMISFGLGTLPLLLLTGISATFLSARVRLLGERAAAVAVIIMGLVLLGNGAMILTGLGDHCLYLIEL
ncbi:MAG: sulfite exporter TauE/SafE family protein [Syntrophobacteraceae bacterium]